jgi:uncharacterized protein YndB with AHSA1/START domain
MAVRTGTATPSVECELVITRVFDVPRQVVFEAFVDPKVALQWMGPHDHPVTHVEADVRPGGRWRACLRAADSGRKLWQGGVFREVVPPERLVYTFAWDRAGGERGPETVVTITFEEQGGKTLMTFRQGEFDTQANCDGHRTGWNSAFDRLEECVAKV